jgi:hypothetical protein
MSNQSLIRKSFGINNDEMVTSLEDAIKIGEIVAKSRMFPEVTDQAKAVVAILAGRELGIPPMASLRGIHVIKGKVEIGAGLLAAMIQQSGKYKYEIRTPESEEEKQCLLLWSENIGGAWTVIGHSCFTLNDAKRAKLIKPDSQWEKYPRAMLFARALTEGQKKFCPEIGIGAVYTDGEIPIDDVIEIPTAKELFDDPRPIPDTPLPEAWANDSIPVQIADQAIANAISHELKNIAEEVKAEAPAPEPEPVKDPDPVPALKPTLTPAQQKVSNAVMDAYKEHKKDQAATIHLIGQFLGRKVKRSADLTDPEAERVFGYLQTCMAQWSEEAKTEQPKFDQKNRAHSFELAEQMDDLVKRLTILGVKAPDLSKIITRHVWTFFEREITNRYEVNDGEAAHVIQLLQDKIDKIECEKAALADEI